MLHFARSEAGGKAKALGFVLLALVAVMSALNVVTSYVGRDFMTAIAQRNMSGFTRLALFYVGMFALTTLAAVFQRFTEERLGLVWRNWMTQHLLARYLAHPVHYRLNDRVVENGEVANPDQRISEDVRVFTVTAISLVLLLLNAGMTAVSFSGVMWSISPLLFGISVAYALVGTFVAVRLGHRLIGFQYEQLDKEASFRTELVAVRANSEAIALLRHEGLFRTRLLGRLADLIGNFRRITRVNRNLGFFTTGYNYLIQVIPVLVIAPLFIRGEAEFGVITQSTVAFTQLLGAFSLIVTQFQSISSFSAVVSRIDSLDKALDQASNAPVPAEPPAEPALELATAAVASVPVAVAVRHDDERFAYEELTLREPRDGVVLVNALSLAVTPGTRVRIQGDNSAAKVALFRATAGVWDVGEGGAVIPGPQGVMFLPEQPYLPPGTLRQVLAPPVPAEPSTDAALQDALRLLQLEDLVERAGGLDVEHDWGSMLSLAEQQSLCLARVLLAAPRFLFLDRPSGSLPEEMLQRVLQLLSERAITYLVVGEGEPHKGLYDANLELSQDGAWSFQPTVA